MLALQQCGLLLEDAAILFENRRYATAIGISLLAREELGRSRILENLWREAANGGPRRTIDEISAACDDHVEKQRHGQLSIVQHGNHGSQLGDLMRRQSDQSLTSDEHRRAREQLDMITEKQRRRTPNDRHERRMESFYVDILDADRWSVPSDLPRTLGPLGLFNEISNAASDYVRARERFLGDVAKPELVAAMNALDFVPILPIPAQLSFESMRAALEAMAPVAAAR